ncbi:MAG: fibronectin type III domain-containing protein [Candidatus Diapherotrites archaeon]
MNCSDCICNTEETNENGNIAAYCGDGECNGAESCQTCPADCGECKDNQTGANVGQTPQDETPPLTSININPYSWYKMPVLVEFNCLDESGCETYYCYDKANACSPSKKGNEFFINSNDCPELICSFYIRYYSEDSYGNVEAMQSIMLRVDNKAPVTSYSGPSNGSTVQGKAEITLSCNDVGSGCKEIRYNVDGSGLRTYSDSIVISSEGYHEIAFYSVDNAGNEELGNFVRFTVSSSDNSLEIRNVKVSEVTQNSAKVSFETIANAEVTLYYSTVKGSWVNSAKSTGSFHEIFLRNLESGTTYYYKIAASAFGKNSYFEGEFSTIGSSIEINLQNLWSSYDSALIGWSTSTEASCQLLYGIDAALSKALVSSKAGLMHESTLSALEPNKKYLFEIKCSSGKESAKLSGEFYTLASAKPSIVKIEVFKVMPDETLEPCYGKVDEGELLKFVATVVNSSGKRYVWDFADGTTEDGVIEDSAKGFLGIKQIESYHLFSSVGEFEVKLSLSEPFSNELISQKSVFVSVHKTALSVELLEPKGALAKNGEFRVKILAKDANGNNLRAAYVDVYFRGQNIGGILKDGLISANVVIQKCSVKNTEFVSLRIIATEDGKPKYYTRIFPIRFEPCKLKAVSGFNNKVFHIGDFISTEAVAFVVDNSKAEFPISYLRAELISSDKSKVLDFNLFRSSASIEVNHKVSFKDLNSLKLHVVGSDIFGNEAESIIPIKVEPRNPDFYIETFALPEKLYLLREERIMLKIGSAKYLKGKISIKCAEGNWVINEMMSYDADNDVHSYVLLLPSDFSSSKLDCEFYAYATDSNAIDLLRHRFNVVSTLKIDFVSPSKQNSSFSEKPGKILIGVSYADGEKIAWNELKGTITVDNAMQNAVFRRSGNVYVAELERPLDFNAHSIIVSINSPLKGSGELNVKLNWMPGAFEIGSLFVAVLIIAVVFFAGAKVTFRIKDAKSKLVAEKRSIISFMKKTKAEYFKRHISEREFKEKYKEAEEKLKAVEQKIKRKEYLRFIKLKEGPN